jgi:hypothetical protein
MDGWAAVEGGRAELGDARRTERLIRLVETLGDHPAASVPQACNGDRAAIKATYRFWDSAAVTAAAIREAHQQATRERVHSQPLLLAIQDTTELNFTAHPATTDLGPLAGRGQQGILVHSTLAVSSDGVPLGLLQQESWIRDPEQAGSRHHRRKRTTAEKESGRWLRAQEGTLAAVPRETDVLTIADREADIYDFFAAPRPEGAHLLVRATHNRRIEDTPDGEAAYVWTTLQGTKTAGALTVRLGRTSTRPERDATLTIRSQPVTLQPPRHQRQRSQCAPIPVVAILATEEHPPQGQTAVCWRLLTTWPVETLADAGGLVEAYTFRWLVERYHYVLQSGCQVEELQLETAERLDRAFATSCVVAWRLLWLTYQTRQDPAGGATTAVTETEQRVLAARMAELRRPSPADPSLREVVRAIATLGGFLGRTGDGEPGVKTLWRGFHELHLLVLGWELHQTLTSQTPPLTRCG